MWGKTTTILLLFPNGVVTLGLAPSALRRKRSSPRVTMAEAATQAPALDTEPPHVLKSLIKMARPNTVPMAAGLVGAGAYGARHTVSHISVSAIAQLALCMLLTIICTSGSMLINDYHDFRRGVDTPQTKPNRPLVRGDISLGLVKRALKWMYAAHLSLICLVDAAPVRLWVLGSTMLTYVYSVHLKPRTGLKNIVCALIVAMAIGLGAMAVGSPSLGLAAVWRPMVITFCTIWHRELLMDIKDMPGDAIAGVATLPVMLGRQGALLVSLLPLALAIAVALGAGGAVAPFAVAPLAVMAVLAIRAKMCAFGGGPLALAIESAPAWLAGSLIAMLR